MSGEIKNKKNKFKRWLFSISAIFFILILGLAISSFIYQITYAQKIYPGIKIGQINVSGKTKDQALAELEDIGKNFLKEGLKFNYGKKQVVISPIVITATDPDLAYQILTFDFKKSIDEAYETSRSQNYIKNLIVQTKTLIFGKKLLVNYNLNQVKLLEELKINFSKFENPTQDAKLEIIEDKIFVIKETEGENFNYDEAIKVLEENLSLLKFEPIEFFLVKTKPKIKKQDTEQAIKLAEQIINLTPINLKDDGQSWQISKKQFANWLEFKLDENNQVIIGLNQEVMKKFLKEIADSINVEPQDAKFKLENNRVTEFQASRQGRQLNIEKSLAKLEEDIIKNNKNEVQLIIETAAPQITIGNLNNLGIKELLGRGESNFAGSPKNRRHNIAVGAKVLNGILIKPDEEFSLLKALGEISEKTGYKPELVIKGNRTIPEFGGGLCQIGTTTFRAALRSGLPITQRKNHSYRVIYYEPAGMDATIYNPSPDFRFLNDTGNYILFTTKIEGDNLIFEFYGTKDGRKVEISPEPPKIYNITSPGPVRYIETEDLKPGEKKLAERSHQGADTEFNYKVTYPNGEVKEKVFYSHYVPWPEVWLVGKEPSVTSTPETVEN